MAWGGMGGHLKASASKTLSVNWLWRNVAVIMLVLSVLSLRKDSLLQQSAAIPMITGNFM